MSKLIRALLITLLVSMFMVSTVFAEGAPVGGCPTGFDLHMAPHHDNHHGDHVHVGTDTDKNGDGFLCVKPITPDNILHVHIDNNVKLGVAR
jgi:hypothetical protein